MIKIMGDEPVNTNAINKMEDNQILVLRDNARNQLMQIKTVEDGITHLNKLKSIGVWVQAEKKDAELQNIIAEQKLRTQRILGTLLTEKTKNEGQLLRGTALEPREEIQTLQEMGINKKQSSTFQQIASIPEETFENFIMEKKEAVNNAVAELTTKGAVRLAKSLQEKKDDLKSMQGLVKKLDMEKELIKLANHINTTYIKEDRIFLVNHIKI